MYRVSHRGDRQKEIRKKTKVIVVAGPTASGKSDLAIQLAKKCNGEIISADSRQVYRGMDVGTGKVKRDRRTTSEGFYSEGIRHWLLDVADPKRTYTVAQYKKAATQAIRNILRRGKVPIVCGGTGFYIDALVYDLVLAEVKPNAKLRAKLEKYSAEQLFEQLEELDPVRAATIDRHNKRRLIRALEIIAVTRKPVPAPRQSEKRWGVLYLVLDIPREILKRRIAKRLNARLKDGMIVEVRRLHNRGVSWQRLENFGLEYRWLARYLQKKISRPEMRDNLLRDIIKYAKRQITWFRRNKDVRWITPGTQAERLARQFLK